jgi:hypothetical protein
MGLLFLGSQALFKVSRGYRVIVAVLMYSTPHPHLPLDPFGDLSRGGHPAWVLGVDTLPRVDIRMQRDTGPSARVKAYFTGNEWRRKA